MHRGILAFCLGALLASGCSTAADPAKAISNQTSAATLSTAAPAENQPARPSDKESNEAKVRRFLFHYRFHVKGLRPSSAEQQGAVQVWLPCAANTEDQQVARLPATAPAKLAESTEALYGNRLLYFQTDIPPSGEFTVDVPYDVTRHEVLDRVKRPAEELTAVERALYLADNLLVPSSGKPLKMLEGVALKKDQLRLARQLYDLVDAHLIYKKEGTGWGRGDANWVCESGYGNCTDFHSLFMSLARSQHLPVRFEIGFSIPTDKTAGPVVGYHCWAWFYADEHGWVPVDISEASKHPQMKDYYFGNLTVDRVMFSAGRDLELVPPAKHRPLNFMVYPYIEVNGEVLPSKNVELQFAFKDLP